MLDTCANSEYDVLPWLDKLEQEDIPLSYPYWASSTPNSSSYLIERAPVKLLLRRDCALGKSLASPSMAIGGNVMR